MFISADEYNFNFRAKRQYFPASLDAGHHGHTLALSLIFFE
jgi:hypothetical protein